MKLGIDIHPYSDSVLDSVQRIFENLKPDCGNIADVRTNVWGNSSIRLTRHYALPRTHLFFGTDDQDILPFSRELAATVPHCLVGTSLLPHAFARLGRVHLSFVRRFQFEGFAYLYVFNVLTTYFGGASASEILQPPKTDYGPSVSTDRLYFECRLVPVRNVLMQGARIVAYEPISATELFGEALFTHTFIPDSRDSDYPGGALFHEPDFSPLHRMLTEKANQEPWRIGNRFWPLIYVDNSIAFNLVIPGVQNVPRVLPLFHDLVSTLSRDKSVESPYSNPAFPAFLSQYVTNPEYSRAHHREFSVAHPLLKADGRI